MTRVCCVCRHGGLWAGEYPQPFFRDWHGRLHMDVFAHPGCLADRQRAEQKDQVP